MCIITIDNMFFFFCYLILLTKIQTSIIIIEVYYSVNLSFDIKIKYI